MSGIDIACLFVACDDKIRIFRRYATNDGKGGVERLKKEGKKSLTLMKACGSGGRES